MKHHLSNLWQTAAVIVLVAVSFVTCPIAGAQTAASVPDAPKAAPIERPQKATERIRTEDAGSRIDEVRVGGETQSISVQPKTGSSVPAYEVLPSGSTKGSAPASSSGGTTGSRVWNVLKF